MSKRAIFGRSKAIERKIDEFLDKVSETALVFVAMLKHTLEQGGGELDPVSGLAGAVLHTVGDVR